MGHVAALKTGCMTDEFGAVLSLMFSASRYLAVLQWALSVPVLLWIANRRHHSLSGAVNNKTRVLWFTRHPMCDSVKNNGQWCEKGSEGFDVKRLRVPLEKSFKWTLPEEEPRSWRRTTGFFGVFLGGWWFCCSFLESSFYRAYSKREY